MEGYNTPLEYTASFGPDDSAWISHGREDLQVSTDSDHGLTAGEALGHSILNCFISTLKVILRHSQINYSKVTGKAKLYNERNDEGNVWFSKIEIVTTISGTSPDQHDRIETIFDKANKKCYVMNSVKTVKENTLIIE